MPSLRFGSAENEYLELEIALPPGAGHSETLMDVPVELVVDGFRGRITPMFEVDDFVRFLSALRSVYETLSGHATLDSRDRQLYFTASGNGRGAVTIEGYAYARATYGNKLTFEITIDQSYLPEPLATLTKVVEAWN